MLNSELEAQAERVRHGCDDYIVPTTPSALQEWAFDPDGLPRAVSAVELAIVTKAKEQSPHAHRKAQLIIPIRGLVSCEVANGMWIVPTHSGLWIPSNIIHSLRSSGNVDLYIAFIDPDFVSELPSRCGTIPVSPLLRELVIRLSTLPLLYEDSGPNIRLIHTLLDELKAAPIEYLHLPIPDDPRLQRIARELMADSGNRITAGEWARRVGMSERNLFRLTFQATGMTFGRWCRQLQIMLALERLAEGEPVQTVAFDLGYESASSFITMFRKMLGVSPAKYIAARQSWH